MPYFANSNVIGVQTPSDSTTIAPGVANLPGLVLESQLGEIRSGWDPTLGAGEFIYLRVPASTAIPLGTVVQWSNTNYTVAVLPVLATSKNTGVSVAVSPYAIASNTSVQFAWFQIQGMATVLKTAVQVTTNSKVYASGTAGRIKILTSAGGEITGMRTANAATVTTTTSTITCYLSRPSIQGQIT